LLSHSSVGDGALEVGLLLGPGDGLVVGPGDGLVVGPGDGLVVGPGDGLVVGPGDGLVVVTLPQMALLEDSDEPILASLKKNSSDMKSNL